MSAPSPFEVAQGISQNISGAFQQQRDKNAIDEILEQANSSGNQEDIDMAMRQILQRVSPEKQQAATQILQAKQAQIKAAKQRQQQALALQRQGLDASLVDLDPSVQKEIIKGKLASTKKESEGHEQVLNAFNRAQEILDSGATGISLGAITPGGRELRSELDTLSEVFISHLIPLLNPKGSISKERFNYIKSLVPSSSDTDAKIKGKLNGLRDIFKIEQNAQKSLSQESGNPKKKQSLAEIFG